MLDLSVIGKKTEPKTYEMNWKDAVLYALGVGAQIEELPFLYENAQGGFKVLPTFAVVPSFKPFGELILQMKLDFTRILHGEQLIQLYQPIPSQGKLSTVAQVKNIYDKGKGALLVFRFETSSEGGQAGGARETPVFYRGEGGFGGDPGPASEPLNPPHGVEPDLRVSYKIPENQAALYRLNGDINPLHIDPNFAKLAGFERPILHGLCTYGYAGRAILHGICGGDVTRFKEFKARFANVVFPGETLITEGWKEKDGRYLIQVRTDRAVVINQAYAKVEA
ncbi:MAG: MaoC/PaaZ C-terminal domain-containing protein [Thermodesulfobacteriota bacterium]